MDNNYDSIQLKGVILNEIKLNLDEEDIKETIKRRKRVEKTKLFIRRIITFSINIVFLVAGWAAIVTVNLNDNLIQKYFIDKFS